MKGDKLKNSATVSLVSGALLFSGCGDLRSSTESLKDRAYHTAVELEEDIFEKKSVRVLPGVVVIPKNVNIRDIPAVVNTNNAGLEDGVRVTRQRALLMRPFIVRGDDQDRSQPRYWLGGYFDRKNDNSPIRKIGFVAVNDDTYSRLRYYSSLNTPAEICPDYVEGVETVRVSINEAGYPVIKVAGIEKNLGLSLQVRPNQQPNDMINTTYKSVPLCRR